MGDTTDADEERTLTDHAEIESWADQTDARPVVSTDADGALRIRLTAEDDPEGRVLEWDRFFSLYDASDAAFVVDEQGGQRFVDEGDRRRFVDDERVPGEGDEDEVHSDGDRRGTDAVDRETDQMEREARDIQNPDAHRDEEPYQS